MRTDSHELEAASTPLPPSSSYLVGLSEAARNHESNVFGGILDTIDEEDWLDELVVQAMKKSLTRGLVFATSGLKEHHTVHSTTMTNRLEQ